MALKASITIEVNLFSNIGTRPLIYLSGISVFVANKAAITSRNANLYYLLLSTAFIPSLRTNRCR